MKKILIVTDYQHDFVDGSLGFPGAEELEPRIAAKIREYRAGGWEVLFTYDTHGENYMDTMEGRKLPVPHCIKGTPGWELYGSIDGMKKPGDKVIAKPSFGSAQLLDYLRQGSYNSVELCGLVTNICILSNAVIAKTALPEAEVIVDASCVGGADKSLCSKALDVMAGIQIEVTGR